MSTLESSIDELYREPLDAFTAARNALAKTLSGADAARVRALAKPSVIPWTVNQLYWRTRATHDRLLKSGERLRAAQIDLLEGRRADVRAAADAHRAAIGNAVKEATRLASAAGVHPAWDALTRTIEALSVMPEPPAPPGRLTEPLRPAGFEALAGVPVRAVPRADSTAGRHAESRTPPTTPPHRHEQDARAEREAREEERKREAAAKEHAAAVKKAEAALAHAQAAAATAQEAADRAQRAVNDAEANLKRLHAHTPD